jgi:hypothetical protein
MIADVGRRARRCLEEADRRLDLPSSALRAAQQSASASARARPLAIDV